MSVTAPQAEATDDFATAISAAQAEMQTAIDRAGLRNDPIRFPLAATANVIGFFPSFLSRMEALLATGSKPSATPIDEKTVARLERLETKLNIVDREVTAALERACASIAHRTAFEVRRRTDVRYATWLVCAFIAGAALEFAAMKFF